VLIALVVTALVAASMSLAMRLESAGKPIVLLAPGVLYAVLTVLAVLQMRRDGTLGEKLRPRSGDLTFGALVTVMLYMGAIAVRMFLAPNGTVRQAWIIRIYEQIGDPEALQRRVVFVSLAVVMVAILEEIAWRGYVFSSLEERIGTRRAWSVTAVLYAAAHLPSVFLLRDPAVDAGINPLVVLAALGCGLVWGLVVARTGRLPVAIFSHALFTWCVAIQFPLWRLG
jgi:membrane protease YdiL (CAAX protease family)